MPVWIKDPNAPPKEGWRYPSIEGSRDTDIKASAHSMLHAKVVKHYDGNGKTPPTEQEMNLWICKNLSVICFSDDQSFEGFTNAGLPMDWRPMPRDEWPLWAKALALLKRDEDKGMGDTIERAIGPSNSAAFKAWYMTLFGKSCGCTERRAQFNSQFPYV